MFDKMLMFLDRGADTNVDAFLFPGSSFRVLPEFFEPRQARRDATNAWGMAYLSVNSASCTSLLDQSQQRPAYGTRSSSRRRRDISASASNDDRSNDGQRLDHGHLEPAMAADALVFPSLNTVDGRTQRRT